MLSAFSVFVLFVVLFALIFVILAVQRVPQGNEWTVERFGRYVRTLEPGLALIIPVVDRVGAKMNMMETVLQVPSQSVITRDNAVVTVDAIVFYQVLDAAKAAYEVTTLELAILNLVMTNIRTVMGSMSLDELLSERDRINSQLLTVVDAATTPWGVKVQRVEIKDITPPQELVAAMARQMKAEREKRANVLEAEGFKQAAVLKAEGEKQAVILAAEARREAAFRDAEARERQAEAEASATTSVSEAIGRGSIQAINYFVAQRYIDAIGRLAGSQNQKVILMPLESASMIGSLAGIAELARESFSTARPAANPAVRADNGALMPYWYWAAFGAVLAVIEVAVPAMVCIWLAAAALGVAAISWRYPGLAWEHQALIFAVLAIASVALGRTAFAHTRASASDRYLNRRAESYIGRMFTLDGAIVDGRGRLSVDDTVWLVAGPDLPAGTRVRVTGAENTLLRVEPI